MPQPWPLTARDDDVRRLARRHADADVGGTVLTGQAGVGKSRLADAVAAAIGGSTARAVGHPSTRNIPLGALAHLLPPQRDGHGGGEELRAELFHQGRTTLGLLADGGRLTVLIDDVDQLDDTSLGMLLPLTVDRTVHLIATCRSGRTLPPAIATLVKDGHLLVETVRPLRRADVEVVLSEVVGMRVAHATVDRLASVSDGNLQVLVELVQAAHAHGDVRIVDGEWSLERVPRSAALEELVAAHLAELPGPAVLATEILAVAGWLPLDDLSHEVDPRTLEEMEAGGVVRICVDEHRTVVELAHPVYGEVVRQRLARLRTRSIQGRLADRLQARGLDRHEDVTRLAWWRVESGGPIEPDLLVHAGRRAIVGRDHVLAERFASEAAARGATHDAARISVEASVLAADLAGVERAVGSVWDDADLSDELRGDLARRLSTIRFAAGDLDGALSVIDDGRSRMTDAATIVGMDVQRAQILANSGRPHDAVRLLDATPRLDAPRVEADRAIAEAISWTSIGRFREGLEAARRGAAVRRRFPEWWGRRGMATHLVNEAHALTYSGRFAESDALLRDAIAEAERSGASAALFWFQLAAGENARDVGDGTTALGHFSAAADLTRAAGQSSASVWVLVGVAQAHLLLGAVDDASVALDLADSAGDSPVATSWGTRERARAWLHAARGELPAAVDLAASVIAGARADGIWVFEAVVLHDLVRFGRAAAAVDRLVELTDLVEGDYVRAMALHARAAMAANVDQYRAAASAFEETGALLFAAETVAELSGLLADCGDDRGAAAARRHTAALLERVGGAATPLLASALPPDGLTPREREVAELARAGLRSAEIATRLTMSVRTVDTHLGRVYRKLGIEGREELRRTT